MKKEIVIGERRIPLETKGSFLRMYKREFKKDPLKEIFNLFDIVMKSGLMQKVDDEGKADIDENDAVTFLQSVDIEAVEQLFFCMAKKADSSIPDSVEDFLDTFDSFPVLNVMLEIFPILFESFFSSAEPKKKLKAKANTLILKNS